MLDVRTLLRHLSGWTFVSCALGLALFLLLPQLETAYQDAAIELPAVTKAMLAASRWVRRFGWMLFPIPIMHAVMMAYLYPAMGVIARRTYRRVLTVIVCAAFAVTILAMFLPYVALLRSLSGAE